jgi:hypothetical protein
MSHSDSLGRNGGRLNHGEALAWLKDGRVGFDVRGHKLQASAAPCGCVQVRCTGGCSFNSILRAIDLNVSDTLCEYHREIYNRTGPRGCFDDAFDVLVSLHDQIRSRRLLIAPPGAPPDRPPEQWMVPLRTLEKAAAGFEPPHVAGALRMLGARTVIDLLDGLGDSEPVYVSDDVLDIWCSTAGAFRPDRIDMAEPFSPRALAVLPRKIEMSGAANCETIPVRAFLWGESSITPGLFVVLFCRASDYNVILGPPNAWVSPTQWQLPIGQTVAEHEAKQEEVMRLADDRGDLLDDPGITPVWAWRDMQAFWRLARSTVRVRERPGRAARRAAGRVGLPTTNVTVIRLRRARRDADPDESAGHVDWSCRWIVRGHWRQLADGRQTFIHAYVKGPEGRPLRATHRVWEFIR